MNAATAEPLVSICLPCHNAAQWLAASIDSALAQTWPRCEILVVDDGSTDASFTIAQGYEPRGVRAIRQTNGGPAAARNHALEIARGDFIKFLDADDLLSPDAVEIQVRALASRPGAIACGEWARFYRDPEEARFEARPAWHSASPVDWLVELWSDGHPMTQCGQFLLPRSLLSRTGGWDARLTLIDDFEFFARVALASDGIVFTPGARLYYRSSLPGSVSGRKSAVAWRSAALSLTLGTDHLIAAEDSPRTRHAAAAVLQALVYAMYPSMPDLITQLEARIAALGGSDLPPRGGRMFLRLRRLIGWKAARRLQVLAGKHPRAVRP